MTVILWNYTRLRDESLKGNCVGTVFLTHFLFANRLRRLQQLFEFRRWVRIFGMRAKRLRFNFSQMDSSWWSVERIFLYNMA